MGGYGMSDFDKAAKALESGNFRATAGKPINAAIRDAANLTRKNARAQARPHRKTGKMAGGIRVRITGRSLDTVGAVKATSGIANIIVGGARNHAITGRGIMPLYQGKGRGLGITGFATAVQHPGVKADPFFHRAIEGTRPDIEAFLEAAGSAIVHDLAQHMK
jgi:hypothetical protein